MRHAHLQMAVSLLDGLDNRLVVKGHVLDEFLQLGPELCELAGTSVILASFESCLRSVKIKTIQLQL